ncbi:DUF3576 domain-containing protein [Rhizomicrobium electricum]|uniref:DUF3576 domain-containing protein n=1 Tax=Rhizomicrobium electricum TaxID=480070 RepID=A0ABN1FD00_9PROT|nr:DUF3576 domain-containing protein [Rhizomicrobium electricum]NIJ49150.1 hypothetical protein [Rhizomicrobium electricum]
MRAFILGACALLLAGCGSSDDKQYIQDTDSGTTAISSESGQRILGVNSYLWHATLDTLSFLPLQSEDPFGGVIISDWYSSPQTPNERVKITVYILDRRLRADGLKVAVFRQTKSNEGWADVAVNPETAVKLTDAILTRARELRLATKQ